MRNPEQLHADKIAETYRINNANTVFRAEQVNKRTWVLHVVKRDENAFKMREVINEAKFKEKIERQLSKQTISAPPKKVKKKDPVIRANSDDKVIELAEAGKSPAEIAESLNLALRSVYGIIAKIRRKNPHFEVSRKEHSPGRPALEARRQAFELFKKRKRLSEVMKELNIAASTAFNYQKEFREKHPDLQPKKTYEWIKELYEQGFTAPQIAKEINRSTRTVTENLWKIKREKN